MSTVDVSNHNHPPTFAAPTAVKSGAKQYPKWFGGSASCIAVTCSHPLDLLKVRLQASPASDRSSLGETAAHIIRSEGVRGLYRGLSAGILRQLTYGSTRFATYESMKEYAAVRSEGTPSTAFLLGASTFSGFCGAIVGNPADVVNVRMQNEMSLPPHLRQDFRGVFDVLSRIIKSDGVQGLFRGVVPNSIRAGTVTGCQLGSYDAIKQALIVNTSLQDGVATQFLSSILAGLVATTLCNPIDVIKTRAMSQKDKLSPWLIVKRLSQSEGLRWTLRGWLPSFARLGPHTAATLLILEQHRALYDRYRGE